MSARDIIATAIGWEKGEPNPVAAESVMLALTAAGYRILAPGEIDKETVEKCAQIVETDVRSPLAKQYDHHPQWFVHALRIAAALRSIGEE